MPDLASLRAQIAAQFPGDIEHAEAGVVGAHVQRITRHPHVVHAAVLRLVERHHLRLRDVGHVHHLQSTVRAAGRGILRALGPGRREDFVGDEHVVLVAPRGVRAANESRAAVHFDLLVHRVQVVLVLRHLHRIRRRAALDAVAHVEHDQAVIPVARVQQAVAQVDVVQRAAGVGASFGFPARHFLRMIRIVHVDHVQRPRAVVREEDERAELVLLVHERRVHAAGHAIGELGDRLRMRRILQRGNHDAVLAVARALAREHEELAIRERHHIVHATRVRHDGVGHLWIGRITDVERVQHVTATTRA